MTYNFVTNDGMNGSVTKDEIERVLAALSANQLVVIHKLHDSHESAISEKTILGNFFTSRQKRYATYMWRDEA